MSLISAYGIGAGRTIAGESDQDEGRLRQRRMTAVQRAEQDKRAALVRDRLVRSQVADAMLSTQQHAQRLQAEVESLQTLEEKAQKPPGLAVPKKRAESRESLLQQPKRSISPRVETHGQALPLPLDVDGLLENSPPVAPTVLEIDIHQEEQANDHRQNSNALQRDININAGTSSLQKIGNLIDDVTAFRGEHFSEKLIARLEDIRASIPSESDSRMDAAAMNEAIAALDFLEGYVEAANLRGADQQKMLPLISDLRQQLLASGTPAQLISVMASSLVYTQVSAGKTRIAGLAEIRGSGRQSLLSTEREGRVNLGDEDDSSVLAECAGLIQRVPAGTVSSSKSSLTKDSDKRREETLVSMTVRSV